MRTIQTRICIYSGKHRVLFWRQRAVDICCVNRLRSYFPLCKNRAWGNGCKDVSESIIKLCPFQDLVHFTLLCYVPKGRNLGWLTTVPLTLVCIIIIQVNQQHPLRYLCSQLPSLDQNLCKTSQPQLVTTADIPSKANSSQLYVKRQVKISLRPDSFNEFTQLSITGFCCRIVLKSRFWKRKGTRVTEGTSSPCHHHRHHGEAQNGDRSEDGHQSRSVASSPIASA